MLGVFITACVKPTQTSANKQLQKATMFFWNIQQLFESSFFFKKKFQKQLFAEKTTLNKVSRSFKKQLFAEKTILQSFKKFQKEVSRRNRREN